MSEDLVLTPGGYRPASRVKELTTDTALEVVDGRLMEHDLRTGRCTPISSSGGGTSRAKIAMQQSRSKPDADIGKWLAQSLWETDEPVTSFTTKWYVPAAPTSQAVQTLFLFNGAMNQYTEKHSRKADGILQPVLQWGESAAGGGLQWAIASWFVTTDGFAFHTPLVDVNEGDELTGLIIPKVPGPPHGLSYEVKFEGHQSIQLLGTSGCISCHEALEVWHFTDPAELPASQRTEFTAIDIKVGDVHPQLSWKTIPTNPTRQYPQVYIAKDGSWHGEVDILYRAT